MADLEIPGAALNAAAGAIHRAFWARNDADGGLWDSEALAAVCAATPLIVATELERIAESWDTLASGLRPDGGFVGGYVAVMRVCVKVLRERAAELRGES